VGTAALPAQAADFGDFMNPGKWFGGGNNDRDYYGPYGYPGYGYGYPGYGYGYPGYGYPGYGYPGYGYGYPGYGYGGYPGQQSGGASQPAPPPAPQ
jgi:hypothetical protein